MKRIELISILLGLGFISVYPQDSIVSIPDNAFLNALIDEGVDTNENGEFSDPRDGNVYSYVTIGHQVWMSENLKYLPSVIGPDSGSHTTTPYYYVYGYDSIDVLTAKETTNYDTYGVLYNWLAATNSSVSSNFNPSGVQGVCPDGWHLPSDAEWMELIEYLGGESVAGDKLKETGTLHWNSPNTMATNESGFTALPGGWRDGNGPEPWELGYTIFQDLGDAGYWWSATDIHSTYAHYRVVKEGSSDVLDYTDGKNDGFSVRCLRDNSPTFYLDEENQLFTFYPNPTNSVLTIESGLTDLYEIEIISLNGQLLFSKEMEGTTHQIDLSSFPKGIYFITIRSKYFVTMRKIIKL